MNDSANLKRDVPQRKKRGGGTKLNNNTWRFYSQRLLWLLSGLLSKVLSSTANKNSFYSQIGITKIKIYSKTQDSDED